MTEQKSIQNGSQPVDENDIASIELKDNPLAREKIRKEQLEDLEDIDNLLAEIPEGHKVAVTRVKPNWCEGHLDTFLVYKNDNGQSNLNANELKRRFGGETLMLRFLNEHGKFLKQRTFTFAGEAPRNNGKRLESPEEKEERKEREKEEKENQKMAAQSNDKIIELLAQLALPQRNQSNSSEPGIMAVLFESMQESQRQAAAAQQAQMQMFMETMRESMNRTAPDPMAQFQQTMQIMAMSKDLLGTGEPKDKDEIQKMMGGILELVKSKNGNEQKAPAPAPRQLQTVPLPAGPANGQHPTFNRVNDASVDNVVAKTGNDTKIDNNTTKSLSKQLSELSAEQLAELVADTLNDIDDDKQKAVFEQLESIGNDGGADYDDE